MHRCGLCGKRIQSHELITVAGVGDQCYARFNRESAEQASIAFDHTQLQPIVREDADGVPHTFQIRSFLAATGHKLEAIESPLPPHGGYRFAVLGDLEAEAWDLFQPLYQTMPPA